MPLPGGISDKLGNRYEGVWTADSLLDLLAGEAVSVTVEPVGEEARGIEFIKVAADGTREFHSAKRQTTGNVWSLSDLAAGGTEESVLGPLWQKLRRHPNTRAVFVSGTAANELNELAEQASHCPDYPSFAQVLDKAQWRRHKFDKHLRPLCGDSPEPAFDCLKRTEVVGITERELIRRVEQRIRADLDRNDGTELDAHAARLVLTDMVLDRFGEAISRPALIEHLASHGYRPHDLARDKNVLALIDTRNATYIRHVEAELIQGEAIERTEAKDAFAALTHDHPKKRVVIVGAAGLGKSCVVAQTLRLLERAQVPVIALRLDIQTKALTSDSLGTELGFRASPAAVLARVAAHRRCVLVVDQMDALSFASGRNQHLWDAFDELLRDADRYRNMGVLLACRSFDAEHDDRLRRIVTHEQATLRISLGLLDAQTVNQAVAKASGGAPTLSEKQLELLRTPLHLSLFLQGDPPTHSSFLTVQDLFARYWKQKRRLVAQQLGRAPKWTEILNTLAAWLSDHQTLSAPLDILDAWELDRQAMASHCVLVIEGPKCRFFHESFFDYVFARSFVAGSGRLCDLLLASGHEQHLFRRAQVRQILTYQRGRDLEDYRAELRDLLAHPGVRFHIKQIALSWLGSLEDPTADEWRILQSFEGDHRLARRLRFVPGDNPGWFPVLLETGTWAAWLDSENEALVSHTVGLLGQPRVMRAHSAKIAALLAPRLDGSDLWRRRFARLTVSGGIHHSRSMFDLFLSALRDGWFDAEDEHWGYHFEAMPKEAPGFACEFLAGLVRHMSEVLPEGRSVPRVEARNWLPATFLRELAEACPETLVRTLLPAVVEAVQKAEIIHEDGEVDDRLSVFRVLGVEHDFRAALFESLRRAMERLASEKPELLDQMTTQYDAMPHRTLGILLLSAWSANGVRYADKTAEHILQYPHRLAMGYAGDYSVVRAVLRAATPHCSQDHYCRLEEGVLSYQSRTERERKTPPGRRVLLLLESLPRERMSPRALTQLEHLLAEFPRDRFLAPQPFGVIKLPSPIPPEALETMNDEQWYSAMREFSPQRPDSKEDWAKGGFHELFTELLWKAQANKQRFAALALGMPDDLAPDYFGAILDGLAETHGALPEDQKPKVGDPQPLDTVTILAVIRRLHGLPGHPCGRTICSAFSQLAERAWGDEAFEILTHYALHDPDPDRELWQTSANGGTPFHGGSPEGAGLNSVRGGAAHAIACLLFQDRASWPKVETAVRGLVADRSPAVRAMAVTCLLALMDFDREEAIRLFLELAKGAEAILAGYHVDQFLHHAAFKHYPQIREILRAMLKSSVEAARANAARQTAVASFHCKEAEEDLREALAGDESCRTATAKVFAHNLRYEGVRATCRQRLLGLFNDECKKVRYAAATCFGDLSSEQLSEERDLIHGFIQSRAFNDGIGELAYALEHSTTCLPDVVCAIPERLLSQLVAGTPNEVAEQNRMISSIPGLVLRVYEQTSDAETKTRCLNVIDRMLELGFGGLEAELQKVER